MKATTIVGISLIIIGILFGILFLFVFNTIDPGLTILWFGFIIMITGLLLLFSIIGASLVFISALINLFSNVIAKSAAFIWVAYGFIIVGLLYGLVEGIIKLVKFLKKKR